MCFIEFLLDYVLRSAVGRKDWPAAMDAYSAALARAGDAPAAFAAVLHANRAAVLQAMGRLPEAVADCLRASALDPSYAKVRREVLVSTSFSICSIVWDSQSTNGCRCHCLPL